ncbi:hypothetical protein [Streptomyces zingiberis]|uniref:Uncharacterized protein n=1 Tax=Streptomyces zingiberis TaxID=2053010 RepID=A0ABX1BVA6_9ACTN|nr:hypothetical protein [Streptomyces zingiberis]NJP99306.1 hypothetical protein [Streptomyces zingiberis]
MEPDSTATVVGAVCTLVGVAIGAIGTFAAARAQLRGALAQADAALAQADTTYRAALDQAHAAQRAVHEQWRRERRRDAYAGFVTALDRFEELVSRPELLDDGAGTGAGPASGDGGPGAAAGGGPDAPGEAARAVKAAHAVVELEGPGRIAGLALTAQRHCLTAGDHARRLAPRAAALRLLGEATDGAPAERADPASPPALALAAHRALTQLREAAFHHDAGRADRAAFDAAHDRAAAALDACGLFTARQKRALLTDPTWDGALRLGAEHASAVDQLAESRAAFVAAARELLDTDAGEAGRGTG